MKLCIDCKHHSTILYQEDDLTWKRHICSFAGIISPVTGRVENPTQKHVQCEYQQSHNQYTCGTTAKGFDKLI